jgi:hypothetical protein
MQDRREISGKAAGWTLLAVVLVLIGVAVLITHRNHASMLHQQEIANCITAYHYTWAHCARMYP